MTARTVLTILMSLASLVVFGRMFQVDDPKTLIANSKLVFIGHVKSVKPSDIRTTLSYPTWEDVIFRWLLVDVEVLEPFKGIRKGDIVHTAMLSVDEHSRSRPMYSPPGMIEPEKGDIFLLCLACTPQTNLFAALRAPINENLSVFPLHRSGQSQNDFRDFLSRDDRFALIWSLVNRAGTVVPTSAQRFRETYAREIGTTASNKLIHLEWETHTDLLGGWRTDRPKGLAPNPKPNEK